MDMAFIWSCLKARNYRVTKHAWVVMGERGITAVMMERALALGEIIEREPHDEPYPSVLILAWLKSGDPLHIKCSRSPQAPNLRIVTVYEPDDAEWESDYNTRKKRKR